MQETQQKPSPQFDELNPDALEQRSAELKLNVMSLGAEL
jgi:hypothetical protein